MAILWTPDTNLDNATIAAQLGTVAKALIYRQDDRAAEVARLAARHALIALNERNASPFNHSLFDHLAQTMRLMYPTRRIQ